MRLVANIRRDPYDVYIGRAGHGEDGYFGNPVVRGQRCPVCGDIHYIKREVLACYETYFYRRLGSDPTFKRRVLELEGKILGCFCAPDKCHGDIIGEYLREHA